MRKREYHGDIRSDHEQVLLVSVLFDIPTINFYTFAIPTLVFPGGHILEAQQSY